MDCGPCGAGRALRGDARGPPLLTVETGPDKVLCAILTWFSTTSVNGKRHLPQAPQRDLYTDATNPTRASCVSGAWECLRCVSGAWDFLLCFVLPCFLVVGWDVCV